MNSNAAGDDVWFSVCVSGSNMIRIILPRCQPSAAPSPSASRQKSHASPLGGCIAKAKTTSAA